MVIFPFYKEKKAPAICLKHTGKAQLNCPCFDRNSDDWTIVLVSGASAAAYARRELLQLSNVLMAFDSCKMFK